MGEVKDAIKGAGSAKAQSFGTGNMLYRLDELIQEVNTLTAMKDEDTFNEGDAAKAENIRKSSLLRSVEILLRGAKRTLESY